MTRSRRLGATLLKLKLKRKLNTEEMDNISYKISRVEQQRSHYRDPLFRGGQTSLEQFPAETFRITKQTEKVGTKQR